MIENLDFIEIMQVRGCIMGSMMRWAYMLPELHLAALSARSLGISTMETLPAKVMIRVGKSLRG